MPIAGQSPREVMHTEMGKFKRGQLHSGSPAGPIVTTRAQAQAIGLSEASKAGGPAPRAKKKPAGARAFKPKGRPRKTR